MPRLSRYTLGVKIDNLFLEILEITLIAKYTKHNEKLSFLQEISRKLDNLKFFVTLLKEAQGLDASKYGQLAPKLVNSGKMLGKWIQNLQQQTPAN
ncbi:MAG: hypothetical protein UR53_C0002G0028 [Candidatus Magasanikbacteria bacterium GW2011_GWC2_34_16]|uniref:Four helix bundle protein n=2 Tax=Candidatus Magasanikiibacteriota TaxID=1752731 RepID=A0A0G0HGB3_9BACT|nr:MAG: hypothetical protein UR53_C0002G0028 [Candidatus Magasanikbacteria bacterium GW2011_GWC2_34_16]KKQ41247.1 MAG: hypothetical protein US58_C0003G0030 [Candidatus Magasanikbacteria bacterium GW2011_GWA2_37_8]